MSVFMSSISVVAPLFVLLMSGWILARVGVLDADSTRHLNRLSARFLLPVMLFMNVYEGRASISDIPFVVYSSLCVIAVFTGALLLTPRFFKDSGRAMAAMIGLFRSNSAIYGLPLAAGILGGDAAAGRVLVKLSFVILLTNCMAVFAGGLFSPLKGQDGKSKGGTGKQETTPGSENPKNSENIAGLLFTTLKSPVVIALIAGFACSLLPFRITGLPGFGPVVAAMRSVSSALTPIAFITLGAGFTGVATKGDFRDILTISVVKMAAIPAAFTVLAVTLLGMRGEDLVALLCALATPTAVTSLPIVAQWGGDEEFCSQIIVFTTALSCASIFVFVYILRANGYF